MSAGVSRDKWQALTKLGETHRGDTELRGHRVLVYGIDHATWAARRG